MHKYYDDQYNDKFKNREVRSLASESNKTLDMLKMLTCLHNNSEFQLNRLTQKIAFKCLEIKLAYFKVEKEVSH